MTKGRGYPSLARISAKGATRTYWLLVVAIERAIMRDGPYCVPCIAEGSDLWFADDARGAARAKSLCGSCPVVVACGRHGIEHEDWGIWGGMDEQDRRAVRRTRADMARRTAIV